MKIRQKGQAIVEFALVLPLFFLVFVAIAEFGMLTLDYVALSNLASNIAREAALNGTTTVPNEIPTVKLFSISNFYNFEKPEIKSDNNTYTVTIEAKLKEEEFDIFSKMILPDKYTIQSAPFYYNSGT